jgi:hypothetical protein
MEGTPGETWSRAFCDTHVATLDTSRSPIMHTYPILRTRFAQAINGRDRSQIVVQFKSLTRLL